MVDAPADTRGYSKLSHFMSESNYMIFKQFRATAVRDLLFLQAELVHLEKDYQKIAKRDRDTEGKSRDYDLNWYILSNPENGITSEQWKVSKQIRATLEQYYYSLLRLREVTAFDRPTDAERDVVNTWIGSPSLCGRGWQFFGRDLASIPTAVYQQGYLKDLIMMNASRGEDDALTRLISGPALDIFHSFWKSFKTPLPDPEQGQPSTRVWSYSNKRLRRVAVAIVTVISSLAPLSSILVLSAVSNTAARLGIVCTFTMAFSLVASLATGARRIEIFAATAAFASVQVVFDTKQLGDMFCYRLTRSNPKYEVARNKASRIKRVRLKWRHAKNNANALLSFDPALDPIGSKRPNSPYRYPILEANQLY
ncbi:hypothetical protein B7494_g1321 [Chlorociboria aeruginascens]|nr:hypothetical protein B7494_g1321 [Chlorociboria aeruginascens]